MRVRDATTLRAYLRLLGMSERALALRAGVGHATVSHLLSGRRNSCSRQTAAAIETVLACPPGVFFEPEHPSEFSATTSAREPERLPRRRTPAGRS